MHNVAVIGVNLTTSWQFLVMFKNLLRFSLMWDIAKMIMRCRTPSRTTSHNNVRRRGSQYDICAVVVRRRRATSYMIVRCLKTSSRIARPSQIVVRPAISQTIPMCCNPIVSSVTTKLRLQYRNRVGEMLEIYDVTHRATSQLGVTKAYGV